MGATTNKDIYAGAVGAFNTEVPWFQSTGMAEEMYNKDQEMFLMDSAPSYWYYTGVKDHRFDKNPKGIQSNGLLRVPSQGFMILW